MDCHFPDNKTGNGDEKDCAGEDIVLLRMLCHQEHAMLHVAGHQPKSVAARKPSLCGRACAQGRHTAHRPADGLHRRPSPRQLRQHAHVRQQCRVQLTVVRLLPVLHIDYMLQIQVRLHQTTEDLMTCCATSRAPDRLCVCGFRVDGKPNLTYATFAQKLGAEALLLALWHG